MTVSQLIISYKRYKSECRNEYVFQSGTHIVSRVKSHRSLSLGFTNDLVIRGQGNVMIRCTAESQSIRFITAPNVKISSIHFQDCQDIEISNSGNLTVDIVNSKFSNSCLILKAVKTNHPVWLTAMMKGVYVENSSLTLDKALDLVIRGRGSSDSDVGITCAGVEFHINLVPDASVRFHDLHIMDCNYIQLHSRSKLTTVDIAKSRFNNSCLKFESKLTRSNSHTQLITINHTTFERCSCTCGSVLLFSNPRIHVSVTLNEVNVSDNYSPLLRSQNVDLSVTLIGRNSFHHNKNFLLHLWNSKINFTRAVVHFTNNTVNAIYTVELGTPIYVKHSVIAFKDSNLVFSQNHGPLCGGIAAEATQILFKDDVTVNFSNNRGLKGGALSLYAGSRLTFNASKYNVTLLFVNNTAQIGGAIYVEDSGYNDVKSIFDLQCQTTHVKLKLHLTNVASFSGNQIYGGWVDWFMDNNSLPENYKEIMDNILEFKSLDHTDITSNPIRVCLCLKGRPDCNVTNFTKEVYGCTLSLDLVGVGQRYNPVISHVEASLSYKRLESDVHIPNVEPKVASLQSCCTTIRYKVNSQNSKMMLTLKPYILSTHVL